MYAAVSDLPRLRRGVFAAVFIWPRLRRGVFAAPLWLASERPPLATSSRTRRPLGREPGRERAMLDLASLENGSGAQWSRNAETTAPMIADTCVGQWTPLATASRTRRPLGREPGRERAMLGLASLESRGIGVVVRETGSVRWKVCSDEPAAESVLVTGLCGIVSGAVLWNVILSKCDGALFGGTVCDGVFAVRLWFAPGSLEA
ncbi:hypothetical protein OHA40_16010 [Nocardia sp. NBC_00508]|uniref:hypothetical protein n=1 Tax=Nocardia sp. NBC_00508 TaxID=2975992 RepID=UPI002E7FBDB0|nr:hypothetical protein [Nocardia sp. NBC_00508]WUD69490.1 hypothetical protein OHA40_16010 [Nocardia sp. NBC_00508]